MSALKSLAAFAALSIVPSIHAWYIELPACLEPFQPFVQVGCFDNGQPGEKLALAIETDLDFQNMTIEMCVAECKGNNFRYAGLAYYGSCYCGETIDKPMVDSSECSFPCSGNTSETCGGDTGINIYQDPTFLPVEDVSIEDYVPLGCWSDGSSSGRTLFFRQDLDTATMTTEICLQSCLAGGFPFAGTEYAGECYCGVAFGNGTVQTDASDCSMPCNGDATEVCGGPERLSLYVAEDLESLAPCGDAYCIPESSTTIPVPTSSTASTASIIASTSSHPLTNSSITFTSTSSGAAPNSTVTSTTKSTNGTLSTTSAVSSTRSRTSSTSLASSALSTTTKGPVTSSTATIATSSTKSTSYPGSSSSIPTSGAKSTSTSGVPSTASSVKPTTTSSARSASTSGVGSTTSSSKSASGTAPPTTTKGPATSTTSTILSKTSSISAPLCTSTTITSPACEFGYGKWCASPLPDWNDNRGCQVAASSCTVQVAGCFKNAGWPDSMNCFNFQEWCSDIKDYCASSCPRTCGGKSDCYKKLPPTGGRPSTASTSVYPCRTTSTSARTPTATSSAPTSSYPVATPTNICLQPTNNAYGYGANNPVGGIPLPVLTCNNLEADWKSGNVLKLYTDSNSTNCDSYVRSSCPGACMDACKAQRDDCVDVYAQGCKTDGKSNGQSYGGGYRASSNKRIPSYFDISATEKRASSRFGDSYDNAVRSCNQQYYDCLVANKNVKADGKCVTYGVF